MVDLSMMGLEPFGALAGAMIGVIIIIALAVYVYYAFAWMTIARKLGKEDIAWLAWVPIAQAALMPILADKEWPWVFILLIPIVNIVFMIMWMWKIYEKRNYPGPLALIPIAGFIPIIGGFATLANLVILGLVAWNDIKKPAAEAK